MSYPEDERDHYEWMIERRKQLREWLHNMSLRLRNNTLTEKDRGDLAEYLLKTRADTPTHGDR